jgi:phosphomannomutase
VGANDFDSTQCGADYVKLYQKMPEGMIVGQGDRGASLDGDADRVVCYYVDKSTYLYAHQVSCFAWS